MFKGKSWNYIAGSIIHFLLGGLLALIGTLGLLGKTPAPEETEAQKEANKALPPPSGDTAKLIAAGTAVTGLLLIIPWTSSLGVLLASGFFGGTICFHMVRGEDYVAQSGLLLLTWIGGYLRNPGLLASFKGCRQC